LGKILVTGATGFTGGALCRRLVQEQQQVVAFVRSSSRVEALRAIGVECVTVDIKNLTSILDSLTGIDTVYHLAAAYRTEHSDRGEFKSVNVEATRNLLEAAAKTNVKRFIHCSTVGVQGRIEEPPASEDYRFSPGDHYQESKLQGELLARQYFSAGLPGVVVRPVGIYGPGDTRFLKLFRPINRGFFVMIGSGKVLYHMTYIDDLVDGFLLAGRKPEALGEVFAIAGEKYTTIGELVNLIAEVLGKPHPRWRVPFTPVYAAAVACEKLCRPFGISPPIYPRRVEFFHLDRAFSIQKAQRLLGYKPQVSLRDGLQRTAEWYRQQGLI
jgi:nucleoside-diphosphate-sugar epimerase